MVCQCAGSVAFTGSAGVVAAGTCEAHIMNTASKVTPVRIVLFIWRFLSLKPQFVKNMRFKSTVRAKKMYFYGD
jgi:hypothetical protein